jgi:hypothetical protein
MTGRIRIEETTLVKRVEITVKCKKCGNLLNEENWYINNRVTNWQYCKSCVGLLYKERIESIRKNLYDAYGPNCACCGSNINRTFDHIFPKINFLPRRNDKSKSLIYTRVGFVTRLRKIALDIETGKSNIVDFLDGTDLLLYLNLCFKQGMIIKNRIQVLCKSCNVSKGDRTHCRIHNKEFRQREIDTSIKASNERAEAERKWNNFMNYLEKVKVKESKE